MNYQINHSRKNKEKLDDFHALRVELEKNENIESISVKDTYYIIKRASSVLCVQMKLCEDSYTVNIDRKRDSNGYTRRYAEVMSLAELKEKIKEAFEESDYEIFTGKIKPVKISS